MRWLVGAAVAVFTFAALGTVADLVSRQPATQAHSVPPTPTIQRASLPTATPRPTAIRGLARLWVNEGAYLIYESAVDERDVDTQLWAGRVYGNFYVDGVTPVQVLKRTGDRLHVEIEGGPSRGRRGWASASDIGP